MRSLRAQFFEKLRALTLHSIVLSRNRSWVAAPHSSPDFVLLLQLLPTTCSTLRSRTPGRGNGRTPTSKDKEVWKSLQPLEGVVTHGPVQPASVARGISPQCAAAVLN